MPAAKSLLAKLEDKILVGDECWEWIGATSGGYGGLKVDGRMAKAHRLVYELLVGPCRNASSLRHFHRKRGQS